MKKYLSSLLCFTLIVGAISTNQGYTELELQIANNFAKKGIIIDYSKNPELYRLNENITRSELMAIALKIKGVKLPDEFVCQGKYADVVDNNWICRTVELSLDNQLIRSPSSDKNTARPLDVVTRSEALAILLKANGLTYPKNIARGSYPTSMPQWQIDVMEGAVTLKIIPSTQGRGPNTIIKRKEVLGLAHNMKYATGEYKLSTITTPTGLNTAPEENTEAAKRNITNSAIVVKQDPVEKLKYTFSVAPKTLEGSVKSVNWYIQLSNAPDMGDSLGTGMKYTYSFTESGKYTIEAKIEDSFGNILTSRMVAEITVIGAGTTTTPPSTTTTTPPPTTTTPPAPGTTVSGEAALTTPPTTGDKVSVKINNVSTTFTVGDSENTLTEVDEAVRTMKIGDKKNVTISSRTGGKITTNTFVVELVDIQRSNLNSTTTPIVSNIKMGGNLSSCIKFNTVESSSGGSGPRLVKIGTKIYATNAVEKFIVVSNINSGKKETSIPVQYAGTSIYKAGDNKIYSVSNNAVEVIDIINNKSVKNVDLTKEFASQNQNTYIPFYGSDATGLVLVINPIDDTLVKKIALAHSVMFIEKIGMHIYFVGYTGEISVFDEKTNQLIKEIRGGKNPTNIFKVGNKTYVISRGDMNATIIDENNKIIKTIDLNIDSYPMNATLMDDMIYTLHLDKTISVINTKTDTMSRVLKFDSALGDFIVSANKNLYTISLDRATVISISPSAEKVLGMLNVGGRPLPSFVEEGKIYLSGAQDKSVSIIDTANSCIN